MDAEFDDVRKLLIGAAPERQNEIDNLLRKYAVGFRRVADADGFRLDNGYGQVMYNDRTMNQLYLLSFRAWRAFEAYSGLIVLLHARQQPFDIAAFSSLPGQADADAATDRLAETLKYIREAWGVADVDWPVDVPAPTLDRHKNVVDQAIQEVALLATSYVLLHEIHHIVLGSDNKAPGGWDEELLCDEFARRFLLTGVNQYVQKAGVSFDSVLRKRAMGIALTNGVYAEITPAKLWGGAGHPPLADRLKANYENWPADETDPVWVYMSSLLAARLRGERRLTSAIAFKTPRELCLNLTELLSD